jgi:hypothetical protein
MKRSAFAKMAICGLAVGLSSCATHTSPGNSSGQAWPWPEALDAARAASESHKILFENDRVRVFDVTVLPHTREPIHTHRWPSVAYVDRGGAFRDFDLNGNVVFDSRTAKGPPPKLPAAFWDEPLAPHAIENLSDEPVHLIRVELKE